MKHAKWLTIHLLDTFMIVLKVLTFSLFVRAAMKVLTFSWFVRAAMKVLTFSLFVRAAMKVLTFSLFVRTAMTRPNIAELINCIVIAQWTLLIY